MRTYKYTDKIDFRKGGGTNNYTVEEIALIKTNILAGKMPAEIIPLLKDRPVEGARSKVTTIKAEMIDLGEL